MTFIPRNLRALTAAAVLVTGAMFGAASAQAGHVSWSVGLGVPGVQVGMAAPQRMVYVQPAPVFAPYQQVYVQPKPVYQQLQPVYQQSYPVYGQPQVVYYPPVYRTTWGQGYGDHRHHHHHHDGDGEYGRGWR